LNDEELISIEAEIRNFLVSAGLQWIVDDFDEAVNAGDWGSKSVVVRHQTRSTPTGEEKFDFYEPATPLTRGRQQNVSAYSPYTPRQRLELLLSALRRATVELPAIQEDTLKNLNQLNEEDSQSREHNSPIDEVRFLPTASTSPSAAPPLLSDLRNPKTAQYRNSLADALSALMEELAR
jgi:hypothetical protein